MKFIFFLYLYSIKSTKTNFNIVDIIDSINEYVTVQCQGSKRGTVEVNWMMFMNEHVQTYKPTTQGIYFEIKGHKIIMKRKERVFGIALDENIKKFLHFNVSNVLFYFSQKHDDKFIDWIFFKKLKKHDRSIFDELNTEQKQCIINDLNIGSRHIGYNKYFNLANIGLIGDFYGKRRNKRSFYQKNKVVFAKMQNDLNAHMKNDEMQTFINIQYFMNEKEHYDICEQNKIFQQENGTMRTYGNSYSNSYNVATNAINIDGIDIVKIGYGNDSYRIPIDLTQFLTKTVTYKPFFNLKIVVVKEILYGKDNFHLVVIFDPSRVHPDEKFYKTIKLENKLIISLTEYKNEIFDLLDYAKSETLSYIEMINEGIVCDIRTTCFQISSIFEEFEIIETIFNSYIHIDDVYNVWRQMTSLEILPIRIYLNA
ncbi:hypothetical protein COBT_003573, partial [Conglomerata obtusa]